MEPDLLEEAKRALARGDWFDARSRFKALYQDHGKSPAFIQNYAGAINGVEGRASAIACLREWMKNQPWNREVASLLARYLYDAGNTEEADTVADRVLAGRVPRASAYRTAIARALAHSDLDSAESWLQRAIDLFGSDKMIFEEFRVTHRKDGHVAAVAGFERAISDRAEDLRLLEWGCVFLRDDSQWDALDRLLRDRRELLASHPEFQVLWAWAAYGQGRCCEVKHLMRSLCHSKQGTESSWLLYAHSACCLRQFAEAEIAYSSALELFPGMNDLRTGSVSAKWWLGKREEAVSLANELWREGCRSVPVYSVLFKTALRRFRLREVLAILREGLRDKNRRRIPGVDGFRDIAEAFCRKHGLDPPSYESRFNLWFIRFRLIGSSLSVKLEAQSCRFCVESTPNGESPVAVETMDLDFGSRRNKRRAMRLLKGMVWAGSYRAYRKRLFEILEVLGPVLIPQSAERPASSDPASSTKPRKQNYRFL